MNIVCNRSMKRILSNKKIIKDNLATKDAHAFLSEIVSVNDMLVNSKNYSNSFIKEELSEEKKEYTEWDLNEYLYWINKKTGGYVLLFLQEFSKELATLKKEKDIIIIISVDYSIRPSITVRFYQDRVGSLINNENLDNFREPILRAQL